MKSLVTLLLVGSLVGCASSTVTVHVPLPATQTSERTSSIKVQVNDLRPPGVAASARQAAFGVPMGNIVFDPPERQLIKDTLEAALNRRHPQFSGTYTCDIIDFGVNTNTTPLYWDVISVVRLNLRKEGSDQELSATHTERTYIWPGAEIISKVVQESLKKIANGLHGVP